LETCIRFVLDMENKEFKNLFGAVAKLNGFKSLYGGWILESNECIMALELQKSSFSNSFYLNINIVIQGLWNKTYIVSKDLIKGVGHIPTQIRDIECLNLDSTMEKSVRLDELHRLFLEIIDPMVKELMSKSGIKKSVENGKLNLIPAVKEELFRQEQEL
jgi:hypothetical protein